MTDDDRPTKPPAPPERLPPPRPRMGSAPRLVVREELAPHAVRQPGAQPPPAPKRARVETKTASPAPPPVAWREETTDRAIPHPLSDHPPRSTSPAPFELAERPSQVDMAHELAKLKVQLQDEQEARERLQRAQLEDLKPKPPSIPPRAPSLSVSLGAAKWWTLVLAALATALSQTPKAAEAVGKLGHDFAIWYGAPSHEQLDALSKRIDDNGADDKKAREDAGGRARDDAARWRLFESWACDNGLNAKGLDCDRARKQVKFEPRPLNPKVKGSPQWQTNEVWPPAPAPQ